MDIQIMLSTCMAHRGRQFTEIAPSFSAECRYVLEALGGVYHKDATEREQALSGEDSLRLHQTQSGPVIEQLHGWLEAQWAAFLRHAGALIFIGRRLCSATTGELKEGQFPLAQLTLHQSEPESRH